MCIDCCGCQKVEGVFISMGQWKERKYFIIFFQQFCVDIESYVVGQVVVCQYYFFVEFGGVGSIVQQYYFIVGQGGVEYIFFLEFFWISICYVLIDMFQEFLYCFFVFLVQVMEVGQ